MMRKSETDEGIPMAEVFVSSSATTKAVGRAVRGGRMRKIGPRLYTTHLTDSPEDIAIHDVTRAGDGTRTHDVQLGKLAFYQLNYARVANPTRLAPSQRT